ncbi:DUF6571 family protein [Streptomyces palmae]|uniref:AG2 protein n=1 Tax=Streptomyces palmae TaxID=1701085 RepID=A0A4Z0HCE4_9ACTN|nr:DUF6571 family protein [Streptomyces palmae]TGB08949.1 hypothetical protein E4099_14505 [Streptomyces palmae]
MSGLTFDDIYHVSFTSLGNAADDWKEMVTQLKSLAADATGGLVKQSDAARWAGVNSDVTKPFVRKTAKEFRDAHTEAKSIWSVLRDAHKDLVAIQKSLKEIVDVEAKEQGLRVTGRDDGTVACAYLGGPGQEANRTQKDLDKARRFEDRINRLIAHAQEIDTSVVRALTKSYGDDDTHNFGHAKYESLDDAQAEQALQLARKSLAKSKKGERLSTKELTQLQELLAYNAKDPEFATDFYKALGPKNALIFEAQIVSGASAGDDKTRLRLAHSIQDSMGVALAAATQPHKENPNTPFRESKDHLGEAWLSQLKRVGRERLDLGLKDNQFKPTGYQVLGTLLRHGEYDKRFLVPLGQDMVTLDRESNGWWPVPNSTANGDYRLNLDKGEGDGWDPMNGLMEAFGHSPEASTAFFRRSTGGGDSDLDKLSNFDYFLGDKDGDDRRIWFADKADGHQAPDDESTTPGKDALGHALEAAVSGRAYDAGGPAVEHTDEQAELFRSVVKRLGTNADLIKPDGDLAPIADSLGNMSAEYMRDINRAVSGGDDSRYFWHDGAISDLSDLTGEGSELHEFLYATAQDPDAYSSITHAQQAVTTEAMQKAIHTREDLDLDRVALVAAAPGSEVYGITTEARADAIAAADDSVEKAKEFNERLDTGVEWAGLILEKVVEPIGNRNPIAGEVIGWAIGEVQDAVLDHYQVDEEEAAEQIAKERTKYMAGRREDLADATKEAFYEAARKEGLDINSQDVSTAADDIHREVRRGYDHGRNQK